MGVKKKTLVVLAFLLAVLVVSILSMITLLKPVSADLSINDAELISTDLLNAAPRGCTPGTTFCETRADGHYNKACQNNGKWGPWVKCVGRAICSKQGEGGKCSAKSICDMNSGGGRIQHSQEGDFSCDLV